MPCRPAAPPCVAAFSEKQLERIVRSHVVGDTIELVVHTYACTCSHQSVGSAYASRIWPRRMGGFVSHAASYPTRHGIPHSTVSAPNRLQNRALIDRPSRRASCARSPEGLHDAPCGTCHVERCVRCASPRGHRAVTALPPCAAAIGARWSARCVLVGGAGKAESGQCGEWSWGQPGRCCGPLLASTSSHPAQLPSAGPLPSRKGYSKRCSLSNPDPPRA